MTAVSIAHQFIATLEQTGFRAQLGRSINYGHKILLSSSAGIDHGALIVYVGKKGSRYVTNELRGPSDDLLGTINTAWSNAVGTPDRAKGSPSLPSTTVPPSAPGTIELWVDGACLQEQNGLRFGWAYVIRRDRQELARKSGSRIAPHAVSQRNVAAEIQAVMSGLEMCVRMGYSAVTVFYDYEGLEAWVTGRWRAKTPFTQDYATGVRSLPLTIAWRKVAAHTGVPMNELVDSLATSAASLSVERHPIPTTAPALFSRQ